MSREKPTYYQVEFAEAQDPTGVAGQAIRSCSACGMILSFSGGGGHYLCANCVQDTLYLWNTGQFKECMGVLKRELEECMELLNP